MANRPQPAPCFFPSLSAESSIRAIGLSLRMSNRGLTERFRTEYRADPKTFVVKEKQRVEGFQYMYSISKAVATVTFIATLLIFWLSKSPAWQAIGIGLTLFGFVGLIVDYFSQHRALEYYQVIVGTLGE